MVYNAAGNVPTCTVYLQFLAYTHTQLKYSSYALPHHPLETVELCTHTQKANRTSFINYHN